MAQYFFLFKNDLIATFQQAYRFRIGNLADFNIHSISLTSNLYSL